MSQQPPEPDAESSGHDGPGGASGSQSDRQPGQGQQGYGQEPSGQQPPDQGHGQSYDPSRGYQQPQYPPGGQPPQGGASSYPQGGADPSQQYGAQQYGNQQPGYPPAQQYPGQPPVPAQQPVSQSDEKLWATLTHISIPFFGFVGPLIVYLVFKDRSHWLKDNSVEALNFSILYSVAQIVSTMLTVALIGALLLPLVFVGGLILCILAAVAANKGQFYKYPVNWRLIK
ncbi:MAG: DUF4870 domain-containing protein [Propionibacteriaceae bacterium]|nr:DUF4870 domain-containing protein [Propionibacteriaceae bacterium]